MAQSPKLPPVKVAKTVDKLRSGFYKVQQKMVPPQIALLEIGTSFWQSQAVYVAARLKIADVLSEGSQSAQELAAKVEAHPDRLYRILRALASIGIFKELENGHFQNTALSEALRAGVPGSTRDFIIFQNEHHWAHWGDLLNTVRTGAIAVEHIRKMPAWDYLTGNREIAETFERAMTNVSDLESMPVIAVYDFSSFKKIVDVAGGNGRLLSVILNHAPQAKGVLFDFPKVVERATQNLTEANVNDRVERVGGSFFDEVPSGGDLYIMKHIIHDWSDEESEKILNNVRAAMSPDSKLLLIETTVPAPNEAHFSKWLDLEMMVTCSGKERTTDQWRALLKKSGLTLKRVIPTVSPTSILEIVIA